MSEAVGKTNIRASCPGLRTASAFTNCLMPQLKWLLSFASSRRHPCFMDSLAPDQYDTMLEMPIMMIPLDQKQVCGKAETVNHRVVAEILLASPAFHACTDHKARQLDQAEGKLRLQQPWTFASQPRLGLQLVAVATCWPAQRDQTLKFARTPSACI